MLIAGGLITAESRPDSSRTRISLDRVAGGVSGGQLAVFNSLRRRANKDGIPVYLVGGPVRDAVLNVPAHDLDFVLVGDAPALAKAVAEEFNGRAIIHPRFGTATVEVEGDRVDIVTARKEVYPHPGALPETSPSDLTDDLARRDFTVNAMAVPLSEELPEIIDPNGGLQDLASKLIATLHSDSFTDDPTRMLRAVRYEQRLGFKINETTLSDLKQTLESGHAAAVSGDRWRQEYQKIFDESEAIEMLLRAIAVGVLPAIHPALSSSQNLARLAGKETLGANDYLAALAADMSVSDGEGVSQRLNLSGDWVRVVRDTIALRESLPDLLGARVKTSDICLILDRIDSGAIRASARITEDAPIAVILMRYLDEWRMVSPTLAGDDLLVMGVPPGEKIGEVLRELHAAKLDGLVSTETEERTLVNQIISRGS